LEHGAGRFFFFQDFTLKRRTFHMTTPSFEIGGFLRAFSYFFFTVYFPIEYGFGTLSFFFLFSEKRIPPNLQITRWSPSFSKPPNSDVLIVLPFPNLIGWSCPVGTSRCAPYPSFLRFFFFAIKVSFTPLSVGRRRRAPFLPLFFVTSLRMRIFFLSTNSRLSVISRQPPPSCSYKSFPNCPPPPPPPLSEPPVSAPPPPPLPPWYSPFQDRTSPPQI